MLSFLGGFWFYVIVMFVFLELFMSLFISLAIISLVILAARLLYDKKKEARKAKWLVNKLSFFVYREVVKRSFVSGHVARFTALVLVVAIYFESYYFLFLLALSFEIGRLRVKFGLHDWVDVFAGFVLGLYAGLTALYIFSIV